MARPRQRGFVDRLADAGEEAIQRLGGAPGADRLLGALNTMRDRVDELQRRMRGVEKLEERVAAVERRLDQLESKGKSTPRKSTSSTSEPSTPRKQSSSG
jgi:hypothetical protein